MEKYYNWIKGALDKYNLHPPTFSPQKCNFYTIRSAGNLAWIMTICWVLHLKLIYFQINMNISSIFHFSKSTSINTQYSSLWLGNVIYLHIEGALYAQKSVPSWFLAVFDSKTDKLLNSKIWKKLSILWYINFQLVTVKYPEVEALLCKMSHQFEKSCQFFDTLSFSW